MLYSKSRFIKMMQAEQTGLYTPFSDTLLLSFFTIKRDILRAAKKHLPRRGVLIL